MNVAGALGMASRINKVASAQTTIQQNQNAGNGPPNGSTPTPNKNLSMVQFGHTAHVASEAAGVAQSALSSSSSVPNIGDPAYSPPNAIGNLYT
jgi:hypothetical protein